MDNTASLSDIELAQQIDDAVNRKDYFWLETNSRQIRKRNFKT